MDHDVPKCPYCGDAAKLRYRNKTEYLVHCGTPECKRKERDAQMRRRYEKDRDNGICARSGCNNLARENRIICQSCYEHQASATKKRVQKKLSLGICAKNGCQSRSMKNHQLCAVHREERKRRGIAKYAPTKQRNKEERDLQKHHKEVTTKIKTRTAVDMWLGRL